MLVAGGANNLLNGIASTEIYDPASGTWAVGNALTTPRFAHTATLLSNGNVLVAGGTTDNSTPVSSAELFDPASGTWTATGALNDGRSRHTATLLPDGEVLAE